MLLAAATSSQLLNAPALQLPCPVSCTCCEGPTGLESRIRRILSVATSKIISMAFSSACYSCNIATARSVRHDGSTAAAKSLPGWRSKVVDGLWGGGDNSCREPFSQLRQVHGAGNLRRAGASGWNTPVRTSSYVRIRGGPKTGAAFNSLQGAGMVANPNLEDRGDIAHGVNQRRLALGVGSVAAVWARRTWASGVGVRVATHSQRRLACASRHRQQR